MKGGCKGVGPMVRPSLLQPSRKPGQQRNVVIGVHCHQDMAQHMSWCQTTQKSQQWLGLRPAQGCHGQGMPWRCKKSGLQKENVLWELGFQAVGGT